MLGGFRRTGAAMRPDWLLWELQPEQMHVAAEPS